MDSFSYETEPVGGGNPYWRCISCKRTDPQISVDGHRRGCGQVALHEMRPALTRRLAEFGSLLGPGYWLPYADLIRTDTHGRALLAALDDALNTLHIARATRQDWETACELAYDATNEALEL
jgi:hypothetical protein